jgi:hypothetical protein
MLEVTVRDNQELCQLIQQANSKREAITLVQEGKHKAVLSGCDSDEKIMQLIHEVKEELAVERELRLNDEKKYVS